MIEIVTLFVGIILAQIAPGPNLLAVASASLGAGRWPGLMVAAGVGSGVLIWSLMFAFGAAQVIQSYPQSIIVMQLAGGLYLLYLAFKSLLRGLKHSKETTYVSETLTLVQSYKRGLFVVLTNPKAGLMWIAISLFLVSTGLTVSEFLLVGVGASLSAFIIYGSYAVLFSTGLIVRGYRRFFKIVEICFGFLFGALGCKLLINAFVSD